MTRRVLSSVALLAGLLASSPGFAARSPVTVIAFNGQPGTAANLIEAGPEDLFREALAAVKAESGLNETERKN